MAGNILTTNPMQIDTAGATSAVTTAVWVQGFVCHASDNTWRCTIHDAVGGNILWDIANDAAAREFSSGSLMLSKPIHTTLYVTTMTDIDMLLIYTCTGP